MILKENSLCQQVVQIRVENGLILKQVMIKEKIKEIKEIKEVKTLQETTIDLKRMNKIIRLIPMGIIIIDLTTLKEMTLKKEPKIEEIVSPKIILGVEIKTIFLNKIEIKDNGVKTVKTSIKITMTMKNKIVKTSIILRKEVMILIIKIYNSK